MRRPAFVFALLSTLALALLQCGKSAQNTSESAIPHPVDLDFEKIRARGYLTALVDNNSVSFFIYKGRTMGYEYEMLQRLAKHLKIELKVKVISGIEEAIVRLNKGEGDIIAFPLTVTEERKKVLAFTTPHFTTPQVLVQKKPANWRMQPTSMWEKSMLRNPVELAGKEVYVLKNSSFAERLENLSREIGGGIRIVEDSADAQTESLIRKVATGEIKYTVTDQTLALVNQLYYPNLDISTVVSTPQQIAWAVRLNAPVLLTQVDTWLIQAKKSGTQPILYRKYFESPRSTMVRFASDYSTLTANNLSPFDEKFRQQAATIGWDWRLLAAIAFQESNFDPKVESWAGAIGLMQVMPETGEFFKANDLWNVDENIRTGVRLLKFLDDNWKKTIDDPAQRVKFVLASYNVGLGHVLDARNLAKKYGYNPTVWDDQVEAFMTRKAIPQYYRDPVVQAGYCRCDGPVKYVKEVLERYEEYQAHITE
jgi:membrane-bound lytic murein transglycosylase F